jgi:hypothetical protein
VVFFLFMVWGAVLPMTPRDSGHHAIREDPNQALADSIMVGAAIARLGAVGLILLRAASTHGGDRAFLMPVGVVSAIFSWGALHTIFTLRYARLFYAGHDDGIDFNEESMPDYADFAYLAFTIGMTFQVSDTDLTTKVIRRTALRHALMSYLFWGHHHWIGPQCDRKLAEVRLESRKWVGPADMRGEPDRALKSFILAGPAQIDRRHRASDLRGVLVVRQSA